MKIHNKIIDDKTPLLLNDEENLKIFSIKLKVQEGEYMMADIICQRESITLPFILLGINNTPFFKGMLWGTPTNIDPDKMRVRFIAKKNNSQNNTSKDSYFDQVIFQDFLLPFVDPLTHEEKLFSPLIIEDEPFEDLTPLIFEHSLKIDQIRTPLTSLTLKISAYWEQKINYFINLWPYIQKAFPQNTVSTLTPNAFKASFPEMGQYLGQVDFKKNGYTTFFSRIKEKKSNNTLTVTLENQESVTLPCKQFNGELLVSAASHFIRNEDLCLCLEKKENGFLISQNQKTEINTDLTLRFFVKKDLLQSEWGSFFDKEESREIIEQALHLSFYKLFFSNLNYAATFSIPFEKGAYLKIGQAIHIHFKGEKMIGKISKLSGFCDAKKAFMNVIITLMPKNLNITNIEREIQNCIQNIYTSHENDDPFIKPETLTSDDFIKSINIQNCSSEQEELLKNQKFKSISELQFFLRSIPTIINMELLDLRNKTPFLKNYYKKEEISCTGATESTH